MQGTILELRSQWKIGMPLAAMNLIWFAKIAITTVFLGRLGKLQLAGSSLGFTFANVTGFSVLNGLCAAMEPICGQAFGANNFRLLHKSLVMAISLLLAASIPVAVLWLNVDRILLLFGQQEDISFIAKQYLVYLIPDLVATSFLCPLKAYLSTQNITVPIMFSSAIAVAFHIPVNILLSKANGVQGVSMAVWITDLMLVLILALYVLIVEQRKGGRWKEGGWWDQETSDWIKLLKLSGPCCLTTCLEWWCLEILVLLAGRLRDAKEAVGALAIVLNFDYLLYSLMLSLATSASVRVSNELGANHPGMAYRAAYVSLSVSIMSGFIGGLTMVAARCIWGPLFSHDKGILTTVKKTMLLMAIAEMVNFPLAVTGGIVRGTARPWLAFSANIFGFYLISLPLGVILAFKIGLGLGGLLVGFSVGTVTCLALLLVFVTRINWDRESKKAQMLTSRDEEISDKDGNQNKNLAAVDVVAF